MSFNDIKGQDKSIRLLQAYINQDRLTSSYLFIGPEGIGKGLVAKTLAKALNCQNETLDSCDRCTSCLKIEKNQHVDIHAIDSGLDSIKIEDIRQLQKDINLKPYEGKYKVFIINNAHKLTAEAENALLKILEEPPQDSLIILVSSKPTLLFKTIISRCQIVKFFPFKRLQLKEILQKDYGLDKIQAHFLAYFYEGRLGSALRFKETDILKEKNKIIDYFVIRKSYLENFSIEDRDQIRNILHILAAWFRDIYLIKIGMPHDGLIHLDRRDELLRLMGRFSFIDLDNILNSISESFLWLEQNINVKLLLANLKWSLGS